MSTSEAGAGASPHHLTLLSGLYGETLSEGGNDAERVGWESVSVQNLRFEALLEALSDCDYGPETRLLDVGCGLGNLVGWLERTGRQVEYLGIDVLPEMIEGARARHPEARFECVDLFDLEPRAPFDIVVCSGGLSIRFGAEDDDDSLSWAFIERLYALCSRVAAFNVQSDRELGQTSMRELRSDFWYIGPEALVSTLQPQCRNLVVREDTVPSDAVVYMFRDHCSTASRLAARGLLSPVEMAEIHLQRDENDAALEVLDEAPRDDPRVLFLRGVALAHDGDVEEATAMLEASLALDATQLDVTRSLVYLYLTEDTAPERDGLDAAIALVDGLHGPAHEALGRDEIRMVLHERLTAIADGDGIYAMEDAAETEFGRAMMAGGRAVAASNWPDALSELDTAHGLRPADGRPRALRAVALQRLGRSLEALDETLVVLAACPDHDVARAVALEAMRRLVREAATSRGEARELRRARLASLAEHPVLGDIARGLVGALS